MVKTLSNENLEIFAPSGNNGAFSVACCFLVHTFLTNKIQNFFVPSNPVLTDVEFRNAT